MWQSRKAGQIKGPAVKKTGPQDFLGKPELCQAGLLESWGQRTPGCPGRWPRDRCCFSPGGHTLGQFRVSTSFPQGVAGFCPSLPLVPSEVGPPPTALAPP